MAGSTIDAEVERYVRTGDSDPYRAAWSGGFLERTIAAHDDVRRGLVAAVRQRTDGLTRRDPPPADTVALTRAKVEPMVRGLFRRAEQDIVLAALERSVVVLTAGNIEEVLRECSFDHSAWTLANLYLDGAGAELLSEDAPSIVGMSEETTCYVTAEYFSNNQPFADFIVHETAHIFHNCKRASLGLPETRKKEWLLDIAFRKRETFAYACEAWSRILEGANGRSARRALAEQYATHHARHIADESVDTEELGAMVKAAAETRNGWKLILSQAATG